MLALLALSCFPVAANADSAGAEYENAFPSPTGSHHSTPTVTGGGTQAQASNKNPSNGGSSHVQSESSGGSSAGGNPSTAGNGVGSQGSHGNGSTNPKHSGSGNEAETGLGGGHKLTSAPVKSEDDGSSSPLVPILIALAVLAAISVGVVVMRQRRRPDSSVAPKAG